MSSGARRRRAGATAHEDLQESLLSTDAGDSALVQQTRQPQQQQALIVHKPFDLQEFIAFVVQSWLSFLRNLTKYLQILLWGDARLNLSLVQAERLEELQLRLSEPYNGSNPAHQEQLRELWALAFPGVPCSALKTPRWKDIGWQGEDPATDFRGAGLFGLENLLYLGTHHAKLFNQLLHKTQGQRAEWEYPFAVAGLNLTFTLADLLGVAGGSPGSPPITAAGSAFCHLLKDSDVAFEEVYCVMFALLDKVWLEQKASYMQFNAVLREVRSRMEVALQAKPQSIQQLQQMAGV